MPKFNFCLITYTIQDGALASPHPSIHLLRHLHPSEFLDSGVATLPSHSLVVHGELCSSLERPTPLIFIPTLHPHLHLSPPPRPPHPSLPPLSHFITHPPSLPPSFCPPSLPHVPSLATVSRRALYMQNAPSSSSSSPVFVLPGLLFTFTTQLLTSHTFVWKPPQGFPLSVAVEPMLQWEKGKHANTTSNFSFFFRPAA